MREAIFPLPNMLSWCGGQFKKHRENFTFILSFYLGGDEWSASHPGSFTPLEKAPGTHWVGHRAGLEAVEKRKFPMIATAGN
jgi:hypothetical protein